MRLSNRATIAICATVVVIIAATFWIVRGNSDDTSTSDSSSTTASTSVEDKNFYGNNTQAPTYAVQPGEGDDGGDTVEVLPELSVPQNQPSSYYYDRFCDMAQMYPTLKNEENKKTVEQWFSDAVPLSEQYTDGDEKLIALLDAVKSADDKPAAAKTACDAG